MVLGTARQALGSPSHGDGSPTGLQQKSWVSSLVGTDWLRMVWPRASQWGRPQPLLSCASLTVCLTQIPEAVLCFSPPGLEANSDGWKGMLKLSR